MIATHTPKIFNARLKQKALRARIINDVPPSIICSQSVNMLWKRVGWGRVSTEEYDAVKKQWKLNH